MGGGARGQLARRQRPLLGERAQHEELRAADPEPLLRDARRLPEPSVDLPQSIDHCEHIAMLSAASFPIRTGALRRHGGSVKAEEERGARRR
jgi:hypothetical protein